MRLSLRPLCGRASRMKALDALFRNNQRRTVCGRLQEGPAIRGHNNATGRRFPRAAKKRSRSPLETSRLRRCGDNWRTGVSGASPVIVKRKVGGAERRLRNVCFGGKRTLARAPIRVSGPSFRKPDFDGHSRTQASSSSAGRRNTGAAGRCLCRLFCQRRGRVAGRARRRFRRNPARGS